MSLDTPDMAGGIATHLEGVKSTCVEIETQPVGSLPQVSKKTLCGVMMQV